MSSEDATASMVEVPTSFQSAQMRTAERGAENEEQNGDACVTTYLGGWSPGSIYGRRVGASRITGLSFIWRIPHRVLRNRLVVASIDTSP